MINNTSTSDNTKSVSYNLDNLFELAEEYTKNNEKQAVEEITILIQEFLSINSIENLKDIEKIDNNLDKEKALHKKIEQFLKEASPKK